MVVLTWILVILAIVLTVAFPIVIIATRNSKGKSKRVKPSVDYYSADRYFNNKVNK